MKELPEALAALGGYRQFIICLFVPKDNGKTDKFPVNFQTAQVSDAHNPEIWLDAETAIKTAELWGPQYGVGFVFTENDPFFFVDLDKCLNPDGATWSPVAMAVLGMLPGSAVEVSQSGRGMHIIGTYAGAPADHACKNIPLGLELYTEGRFVALTGTNAIGDARLDNTAALNAAIAVYLAPRGSSKDQEWTTEPAPGYTGPEDDDELIEKALASKSAGSAFSDKHVTFSALWEGDEDALSKAYEDDSRAYDASSADMALAQHLAFWTGNDCERINKIMLRSGLVRDKWDREDYLIRTITRAVSMQETIYSIGALADDGLPPLKGASPKQREFGEGLRSQKLAGLDDEAKAALCSGPATQARFWIENNDKSIEELTSLITPIKTAAPLDDISTPELLEGYQFLGSTQQIEHFNGCVYVKDIHKVFTPSGMLLKSEQFNATYGGYTFQLESNSSGKTTRKAWEAFTESQAVRYPKAESTCFRPNVAAGTIIEHEGRKLVNTYIPVETERVAGDPGPFLAHLAKVLPDEHDRAILLAYMAACIQYKGVKFQWAPLLQGMPGNGKTLFTRCVAFAIGDRHTHLPPANEIAEKFNEWLFGKLFIGVEDVYVPDHKREIIEVLKPMITNDRLAKRAMQQAQIMGDNYANFILNSNHKDAIRKTQDDRRFAVFYTAQQLQGDLARDGMSGTYFVALYDWLRDHKGYAIVANYLSDYAIPDELNPATNCHRAPETSSTQEAVFSSLGSVEQEIIEAIEEGRPGFSGGWISSIAMERLLKDTNRSRAIPPNKRRDLLLELGYDWHPALRKGRVNNPIPFDENKKPRLYIKKGHISANLTHPAEVIRAYLQAQGIEGPIGKAAEVFSK